MYELQIARIFLEIGALLAMSYLLAAILHRFNIPGLIGALFVAVAVHYTPLGHDLLSPHVYPALTLLADLGVLFLLFFIGLQIDMKDMRRLSKDIIWLTCLNTIVPFIFGAIVMLALGYGWILALVIGLTCMPTAEAVVVPILDEFHLIKTRVGQFIIGAGTLDDVIEVFMIALVSIWIEGRAENVSAIHVDGTFASIFIFLASFIVLAWVLRKWVIPFLSHLMPQRPRNLLLLCMIILLGLSGFSELAGLGMILGAIVAGLILRPTINLHQENGEQTVQTIRTMSYGFLGLMFFFWIGLNVDVVSLVQAPLLALLLYFADTAGKLLGVFIMVPMKKLNVKEAWVIGIGLNARFTTEVIVSKLLLDAHIISVHLFTALVSAASLSTLTVPFILSILLNAWAKTGLFKPMKVHPTKREAGY